MFVFLSSGIFPLKNIDGYRQNVCVRIGEGEGSTEKKIVRFEKNIDNYGRPLKEIRKSSPLTLRLHIWGPYAEVCHVVGVAIFDLHVTN